MCGRRRSFSTFAAPLSPLKSELLNTDPEGMDLDPAVRDLYLDPTIGEIIAAGSDMAQVMALISDLTNEIHPVFRETNICACKHVEPSHCCSPYFAANPDQLADKEKTPLIASPYPSQNHIVHAIMQLATKFLTHDDTLPFWAGILDCARGPRQQVARFRVHPRKRLSAVRKAEILEELDKFADEIRVHFREFGDEDKAGGVSVDRLSVKEGEPDFDPATAVHKTCDHVYEGGHEMFSTCDCPKGPAYAFRDGKPVVEDSRFQHIFMNTKLIKGFNATTHPAEWQDWSIWNLQQTIFSTASIYAMSLRMRGSNIMLGGMLS